MNSLRSRSPDRAANLERPLIHSDQRTQGGQGTPTDRFVGTPPSRTPSQTSRSSSASALPPQTTATAAAAKGPGWFKTVGAALGVLGLGTAAGVGIWLGGSAAIGAISGLGVGAIAGIAVGVGIIAGVVLYASIGYVLARRRQRKAEAAKAEANTSLVAELQAAQRPRSATPPPSGGAAADATTSAPVSSAPVTAPIASPPAPVAPVTRPATPRSAVPPATTLPDEGVPSEVHSWNPFLPDDHPENVSGRSSPARAQSEELPGGPVLAPVRTGNPFTPGAEPVGIEEGYPPVGAGSSAGPNAEAHDATAFETPRSNADSTVFHLSPENDELSRLTRR